MHRLLIADSSQDFCRELSEMLQASFEIRCCNTGSTALECLREFRPDVLVIDLMLPCGDGISVLCTMLQEDIHPAVLATTAIFTPYVEQTLLRLDVAYCMRRPCLLEAVRDRVLDLRSGNSDTRPQDYSARVTALLLSLGFGSKQVGFDYLRCSIEMAISHPGQQVTKTVYPAIAKRFGTNSPQVEHAIRMAIERAWSRSNQELWQQYFLPDRYGQYRKPTNSETIERLALYLRMQQEDWIQECLLAEG